MTSTQRTVMAALILVLGVALIVVGFSQGTNADGSINANAAVLISGGFGMVTAVLGFVFGNQNGEVRLARALKVIEAEQIAPGSTTQTAAGGPAAAQSSGIQPASTMTPAPMPWER